ncbi:MAG: DUF3575 domain-containing protein [Candidatus Cryptobacteroides sp.]
MYRVKAYLAGLLVVFGVLSCPCASGQTAGEVHGWDRWSFRINALELLCTVPNFSVEFDLSPSPYARSTLSLGVKYNWQTWHTLPPKLVFNMLEVRPEYRYWFRLPKKEGKKNWFSDKAFFAGAYMQAGNFSIKPGTYGLQGPLYGAGASFGFDFPLYSYRKFALDFELGIAAGLLVSRTDCYTLNRAGTDYIIVPDRSKSWHLVPYPAFTEIKACFVFRTCSIKDKYSKVDQKKLIEKQEKAEARALEKERKAQEKLRKKEARLQEKELRERQRREAQKE